MKHIIGIDPGGTIGMSYHWGQSFIEGGAFKTIEAILEYIRYRNPDQIVMEDFIITPGKPSQAKDALKQIGVVEYYCRKNQIPLAIQSPSLLSFGLKRVNIEEISPHIRSACAHVIVWCEKNGVSK